MAESAPKDYHETISNELERYQLRRTQRYVSITVLILYWKENDLKINDELQALQDLFQDTFNYRVERYEIPSAKPQYSLGEALNIFLMRHGTSDSLVIVYYGGHGGPTQDGSTECEWAASNDEFSPTLDWSAIQTQLLAADCDVVILLDCCYAGSAVRGKTRKCVEILLATDKDQMTPMGSGRWPSFTKVLTQKMKEIMVDKQEINMRNLHAQLVPAETGLRRQPILVSGRSSVGNIVLRKCATSLRRTGLDPIQTVGESRSKDQLLLLEVYTHETLGSTVLEAIISWLTKDSPSSIADIRLAKQTVSNISSFRSIGAHLLQKYDASEEGRNELNGLLKQMEETSNAPSQQDLTDEEAMKLVELLQEKSQSLNTMIEDLLASLEQPQLEDLVAQEAIDNVNLRSRIEMRLILLDDGKIGQKQTLSVDFIDQAQENQRFRVGMLNECQVLVEYCYYEQVNESDQHAISKKIARMSALLLEPKSASFRTLSGVGYTHERLYGPRFGFIYHKPQRQPIGRYTVLSEVIEKLGYVPLESRIRMSRALCEAMLQLHSIGWYHKAIRSSNVLLFCSGDYGEHETLPAQAYDFGEPYLVGFDASRPADAESRHTIDFTFKDNLYRHPDRWGVTSRFQSHHDLYAFGILLLEIGCWRLLPQMDSKRRDFEHIKDPEKLREFLLSKALERLAHYTGTTYANAVRMCLERKDWAQTEEWQLQRAIREDILAGLGVPK